MHPMPRTLHGFEALLEREWIQAGHPFWSRAASSPDTVTSQGPVFLLFLGRYNQTGDRRPFIHSHSAPDCVYQIYQQFPCSFEFTESLLVQLADHSVAR